ncbi:MAG: GNAT family N-acetyltransferase [Tabrizicola sp.]|nr:GNAT family N-acetyltransferase [Tabrizicola sp.]
MKAFPAVNVGMGECEDFFGFEPFQQSAPYAQAAAACGASVRWCELAEGRALVIERARLRMILRGPVWQGGVTPRDQAKALRSLARWPGLTIATPETRVQGFGFVPLVTPMHHAIWYLGPEMRKGFSGKWRNRLTQAETSGLRVVPGNRSTLDCLLREEAALRRDRGYRSLPQAFTTALPQAALRLWDWRPDGGSEGAMAFVVHGSSATYHLGWASERARQAGVHTAMLVRAAEALQAEGVRWLDLGSVDTERAPGLARFKLGTGARLRQLGPTVLVLP